ncbi:long-chain-fatty-acid--CoA ligase [Streptomyces cavernicola]|uniref:Long-chain fatty acid--CoA ligase n=1 Tax=Streptomyces cavernicola TaxID=3043613 RepID=A0ABT6SE18_9ACTN|nr:long-chain fatty acid--CoA ligase [Streptomyces sp. B-S-A6]MDI3406215.1 long-chain fatty acid--CoA ligase [Streptomyces sp. B-S-A6]
MLNLAMLLEDSAREQPSREAVVCGSTRLSYAAVEAAANQVAHLLVASGIEPGDRVALACPNVPYFPIVYYGILKAGGVVVPLNVLLKSREIAYHLEDSQAKAFLCFEGTEQLRLGDEGWAGFQAAEKCEHFFLLTADPTASSPIAGAQTLGAALEGRPTTFETVPTEPQDTAVILYTSGTTGQPKGAELSHANMLLNARLYDVMYEWHPHDVQLIALPLFHSFAQTTQMNAGFYSRATLVLLPRFSAADVLTLTQREQVTFFAGVPTMYWELLNADTDSIDLDAVRATLRVAVSGGAPLPPAVLRGFTEKFGVQILEGYGLSETCPTATFNRQDRPVRPGSIGLPVWGVEVRVVDEDGREAPVGEPGELVIKGHNVMKGYFGRPAETAEALRDGWFHTGDIGRRDEDGYLYIVDRVKDLIIRGGFNVYPREVEEALMTHPAVSLAAVVGVPHNRHGEEVKAFVIPTPESTVTEDELVAWSKAAMAGHKYPRLVEFREALPLGPTGKILKRELA